MLGVHVGDVLPLGAFTMDQEYSPDFNPSTATPYLKLDVKVVGLVVFSDTVVYDDTDPGEKTSTAAAAGARELERGLAEWIEGPLVAGGGK